MTPFISLLKKMEKIEAYKTITKCIHLCRLVMKYDFKETNTSTHVMSVVALQCLKSTLNFVKVALGLCSEGVVCVLLLWPGWTVLTYPWVRGLKIMSYHACFVYCWCFLVHEKNVFYHCQ